MIQKSERVGTYRQSGQFITGGISMWSYAWPLALVVMSNVFYQICAKSVPGELNPFASLTVTYTIGAVASLIMFFVLGKGSDLIHEYQKLNWAPFIMGLAVVGLEVGYICVFRAGWPVSIAQIVQAAILAIILIFVGFFAFKESITWNKVAGIAVCLVGLGLISYK